MTQTIKREELLHQLELVEPGLSAREIIEQSSCFVFREGSVFTFNDEIACSHKCGLSIEGAVKAKPLLSILSKLQEDTLEVYIDEGEIIFKGKGRKTGIRMDAELLLPIESVERPKKWKRLPEEFGEIIKVVQDCASGDESKFSLTCIHITPTHIEACDNLQLTRSTVSVPVKTPILVKRDAVKHLTSLDMTKISETENWVHFKNEGGLVISCRRYVEDYPDLSGHLSFEGSATTLPRGLAEAAEKAAVFSSENVEDDQCLVKLKEGKMSIKGTGASGWYSEIKKLSYKGPPISFMIKPTLLINLLQKRDNVCEIGSGKLKVETGNFVYITVLGAVEKK